jgi:hypothetical protein
MSYNAIYVVRNSSYGNSSSSAIEDSCQCYWSSQLQHSATRTTIRVAASRVTVAVAATAVVLLLHH